jgi:hypothetical protein
MVQGQFDRCRRLDERFQSSNLCLRHSGVRPSALADGPEPGIHNHCSCLQDLGRIVAVWLMNGGQIVQGFVIGTVSQTWSIQGLNAD